MSNVKDFWVKPPMSDFARELFEEGLAFMRALTPMDPHNMPDRRPRDYDDLPRPVRVERDEDDEPNADPFDDEEGEE